MNFITRHSVSRISLAVAFALLLAFASYTSTNATASAATSSSTIRNCGPTTKTVNLPTLRRGDSGSCVKYAQSLLLAHEVMIGTGNPDGKFGPGTLVGVKNFQTWFEVKGGPDGIVGQNTWKELRKPYINPVE